jgi:pyruvate/2-oxoglutarate dehydrogenase complex dihydrolipoamide acyltransferase (E2) component
MYAVDRFAAVITRPDVMTLAMGRTRTAPRWDGSAFLPHRVLDLTLSAALRRRGAAARSRSSTAARSPVPGPR